MKLKNAMCIVAAFLMVALSVGCVTEAEKSNNGGITKAEARQSNGRGADGEDLCEEQGWYGDGECDDFCVNADPDCATQCSTNADCQVGDVCDSGRCVPLVSGECGGFTGLTCGKNQYCNFELDDLCGAADATGECQDIPEACTLEYAPVCGCDGVTYGNGCSANAAGTSVASPGSCDGSCQDDNECEVGRCIDGQCLTIQPNQSCGGRIGELCGEGEYCDFSINDMCDFADATGQCMPRPDACDASYSPVCGCDMQTYGNACSANAAGVSVLSAGECPKTCDTSVDCQDGETCTNGQCVVAPVECGGLTTTTCGPNEFCKIPTGLCAPGGPSDLTGICAPKETICIEIYAPVCGCDGKTYDNECDAASNGVSIEHTGKCD